ncbi:hypothetical protein [Streptomyces sp. NPDC050560]|uniref:hypothetical protein n=1 Tax=Streptomyces sp. NPDC050560 TaxID=3365630 RepID=UPI003799115E
MSTTHTGADEPQPRRRRLTRRAPFTGLPGRTAPGPRPAPGPGAPGAHRPLVHTDPAERALLRTANKRGRRAARRGTLDPWVLGGGDLVSYFGTLASVRDSLVHRWEQELSDRENAARVRDAQAASDVASGERDTRLLDERLREARRDIEAARRQLDLLASRSARWLRFRDRLRERMEERWLRTRFPDAPGTPAPDSPLAPPQGQSAVGAGAGEPDGDDWVAVSTKGADDDTDTPAPLWDEYRAAREETRDSASAFGWEGLQTRPGLPRWLTWALLLVVMAVEVPVYWVAYQPFHGVGSSGGDLLSGTLAVSSAVIMLTVPHLAGHMLRWRAGTGSPRSGWVPALSLLGVWAGLTWALGTLRAKYVLQHDTPVPPADGADGFRGLDDPSGSTGTLVDNLHLSSQTVTWLFTALLLLSGGVGLLLGLFREHPLLDAFRSAVERHAELGRRREESIAATERARSVTETAESRQQDRRDATDELIAATRELHEAAAHEYLEGVMAGARDPALTESAMRLSRNRPLLPPPLPAAPAGETG